MPTAEHTFAVDHPAAEGHFPGNPIIPGAVLLSATLDALERALGSRLPAYRVKSAKFFLPTRPGDTVAIEFSRSGTNSVKFAATVRGDKVLAGEVECSADPAKP